MLSYRRAYSEAGRAVGQTQNREPPRLCPKFADMFSIEASFALFLFAGRYKGFPELQGFPVDFTLFFFGITFCLIAWALIIGRIRPIPLNLPVVLMIGFTALTSVSLFWSSIDERNVDKLLRFLVLTSPSFFAAQLLSQDRQRRERLLRLLVCISCAILLYYAYYRYVVGVELAEGDRLQGNNYLQYALHAYILFIAFLSLAIFGSLKQFTGAIVGACAALFGLVTIGGRGPLILALLAIPLLGVILVLKRGKAPPGLLRMLLFLLAVIAGAMIGYTALVRVHGSDAVWEQLYTFKRYETQLSGENTNSLDYRQQAQQFAFRQWQEKPIFGWGIGEFRVQDSWFDYPHNLMLEILMEMGLAGGLLFFAVCVAAVSDCVSTGQGRTFDWINAVTSLLFLTDLVSHVTVEGYLADDREFLAYIGLVLGGAERPFVTSPRPSSFVLLRAARE